MPPRQRVQAQRSNAFSQPRRAAGYGGSARRGIVAVRRGLPGAGRVAVERGYGAGAAAAAAYRNRPGYTKVRTGGTGAAKRRMWTGKPKRLARKGYNKKNHSDWVTLKKRLHEAQPLKLLYTGNIQSGTNIAATVNAQKAFTVDYINTNSELQFNALTVGIANTGAPTRVYDAYQMSYHSKTRILNTNTVPIFITLYYCKPRKYGWSQTPAAMSDPIQQWTQGMLDEKGGTADTTTLGNTPFMSRELTRRTQIYNKKRIEIAPGETYTTTLTDTRCHKLHLDEVYGVEYNGKSEWGTKFLLGVLEGSLMGANNAGDVNKTFLAPVSCKILNDTQVVFKQIEPLQRAQIYNATNLVAPIGAPIIINEDVDKQDVLYSIP